jgi:nucleoside-diphosphate-sugar epimerase
VSPGEQILDLVHVRDVVEGLMAAAELVRQEPAHAGRTYALHSIEQLSLRDVIAVWENVTSAKAPVFFGGRPYREREMMAPTSTPTLPGWRPTVDLQTGLREVWETSGRVED